MINVFVLSFEHSSWVFFLEIVYNHTTVQDTLSAPDLCKPVKLFIRGLIIKTNYIKICASLKASVTIGSSTGYSIMVSARFTSLNLRPIKTPLKHIVQFNTFFIAILVKQ